MVISILKLSKLRFRGVWGFVQCHPARWQHQGHSPWAPRVLQPGRQRWSPWRRQENPGWELCAPCEFCNQADSAEARGRQENPGWERCVPCEGHAAPGPPGPWGHFSPKQPWWCIPEVSAQSTRGWGQLGPNSFCKAAMDSHWGTDPLPAPSVGFPVGRWHKAFSLRMLRLGENSPTKITSRGRV